MKKYIVVTTGQQPHIDGNIYEDKTANQVQLILEKYWDEDYPKPQINGKNYELNGDLYITITEII